MGGENVKITMIHRVLRILSPDLCYFCHKIGASLCNDCKYDIISDRPFACFRCGIPDIRGACPSHRTTLDAVWAAADYSGGMRAALHGVKFHNDRFATAELAAILSDTLPHFPEAPVLVPVPSLSASVRRRGYNHVQIMTHILAAQRGYSVFSALRRTGGVYTQHDTQTREEREVQVKGSFYIDTAAVKVLPRAVVLIDDIVTTGSTLQEIASVFRHAGVESVTAAVVARTP